MSQTETRAMLRNVIFKLKETKTHAEIMGWLVAEAVTILKDLSFSEPDFKAKQVQAKPATIREDPATGPERQVWVAPTNGFWRHDGRFVPSADWKPVEKPVAEEPTPVEPKRMIAVTLPNGMTKLYEDTPAFRAQRAKEEKESQKQAAKPVFVPQPVTKAATSMTVPKRVVANTHADQMSHFATSWDDPTVERND